MRVLILGSQGQAIVGNGEELFRLVGSNDIELISQELVDPLGREVMLSGSGPGRARYRRPTNYTKTTRILSIRRR